MRARLVSIPLVLIAIAGFGFAQDAENKEGAAGPPVQGGGPTGGTITDGTNSWDVTAYGGLNFASTDFEVPTGTDHQFGTWWLYRVAGDTAETPLPPPDADAFIGDTATLTWADVDARGLFSATLTVTILDGAPGAILVQELDIANLTASDLDLQIFQYTDMDMDTSAGGDSAVAVTPTQIEISETAVAQYHGVGFDAFQVEDWPILRDALNDIDVDDLVNTGLPFGPDDFTGGFQAGVSVPGEGGAASFVVGICLNTGTTECLEGVDIFADGFESGDAILWTSTSP